MEHIWIPWHQFLDKLLYDNFIPCFENMFQKRNEYVTLKANEWYQGTGVNLGIFLMKAVLLEKKWPKEVGLFEDPLYTAG